MASGPTLAKSLSDQAAGGYLQPGSGLPSESIAASNEGRWKAGRIAELRQWLAGGKPDSAEQRRMQLLYSLETRERFRLDSLISVSPVNRARMFAEGEIARNERMQRFRWELELSELTGGIL